MLIFYLCQGTLTLLCHPCSEGPLGTGPSQVCMVAGSTRFGNKKSSATACSVHPGCRSQTENLCVNILKRRSPLTRRLCSRKVIYFSWDFQFAVTQLAGPLKNSFHLSISAGEQGCCCCRDGTCLQSRTAPVLQAGHAPTTRATKTHQWTSLSMQTGSQPCLIIFSSTA